MTRVVESSGARLLPPPAADTARLTAWAAQNCTNADLRTTHPMWADIAATLTIERTTP